MASSEFVEWIVFLDDLEWRTRTKQEYYMANLILRIVQAFSGDDDNGNSTAAGLTVKDMLMDFKSDLDSEWSLADEEDDDEVETNEFDADNITMETCDQEHIWRAAMSFATTQKNKAKERLSKKQEMKKKAKEQIAAKSAKLSDPVETPKTPLRRKRRGK